MTFKRISTEQAQAMISEGDVTLADVRDKQSYLTAHIQDATHLDNNSLDNFVAEADHDKPLIVYCYHGNSSQGAADFLSSKGFKEVYSMDGGFEVWRSQF